VSREHDDPEKPDVTEKPDDSENTADSENTDAWPFYLLSSI